MESVVCTPWCAAHRPGTMPRWRTSGCGSGSSTTRPVSGWPRAATLAAMDDFVMAGECETGESAIELIRDGGAGIVLMDIHMPGMGGIEAARRIRAAHPDLMVLLMSTYDARGPSRWGGGLRRRGLPAQGTPESRSADPDMASRRAEGPDGGRIGTRLARRRNSFSLAAFQSSSWFGHDLIHRFRAERFEVFLSVISALWFGAGIVLPLWEYIVGAAIPVVAGLRRGLRRRSASCWASRCAWRDAVAFSNRSRWFVSVTGSPFCCVTFVVAGRCCQLWRCWRWCPSFSPSRTSAGSEG